MLTRRMFGGCLTALSVSGVAARARAQASFPAFVQGVQNEARRMGISPATLDRAFANVRPNDRVLELDRKQPEFTLTWAQYRARIITEKRMTEGRANYAREMPTLERIWQRFRVDPRICVGIWGLETSYGAITGGFNVIEALSTLAWEGRRAAFFRSQLMDALRILERGDIQVSQMTGSYAGAMGQPQFMPNSYNRLAIDFDGDGRRDIWNSRADALGSIANYLSRSGWRADEPWGQPVVVPPGFVGGGRDNRRSLGEWQSAGVRRQDGQPFTRTDVPGAVVMPDGAGGDAFMVYANFNAIRRYNPSDFYALGVGLLADSFA